MDKCTVLSPRGLLRGWKKCAARIIDLGGSIFKPNRFAEPFEPGRVKSALVIRLDHIGDVVMSTAFVEKLHVALPDAAIDVMVKPACASVIENNPHVRRIIPFHASWTHRAIDDKSGSLDFDEIGEYDLVISMRGDLRENKLARTLSRAWTVGFDVRGGGFHLTHTAQYRTDCHQVARDEELLRVLGSACDSSISPQVYLADHELASGKEILAKAGVVGDQRPVIINPGAASPLKQWPVERFASLASMLCERGGAPVLTFGPGEEGLCRQIAASAPCAVTLPQISLRETAAVFALASTVVCNDSGPMHLAAAVGVPVVALFGPTMESVTGPIGKGHRIIRAADQFRPKWFPGTPPPSEFACRESFRHIGVETVLEEVLGAIGFMPGK
ncbi:MAG: glycosyltransferase family 9 protein [Planctomycetes bacterium]|nr:glycosyltransferase family 9 protein [Planctomycetota bacterium]